jgi:plastocyanin
MKRLKRLLFSALALGTAFVFACGGNDAGTTTKDAGTDGGTTTTTDGGTDGSTTAQVVNGCKDTDFVDLTSSAVANITFPSGAAPQQYSTPCVTVKVGSSVNFAGAFSSHPLTPVGGDTPSPIIATSAGTNASFNVTTVGTFGFECALHPTVMHGAIRVVN